MTRDVVLGRRKDVGQIDLLMVVADATHLRPGLRLAQELRACGIPILVVLNMIDIARHRGITIDAECLERELGLPVVTSTAVRRGGMEALWGRIDALLGQGLPKRGAMTWQEPTAAQLRMAQRQADSLIARAVHKPVAPKSLTEKIDAVVLTPFIGPAFLLVLMFAMFQAVFAGAAPLMDAITAFVDGVSATVSAALPEGLLRGLVVDGAIAGVGSVIIFLPQIVILFAFILILEDLGYMARAAFLMDRIMGHAGLHGRAFIPLLSSFACAVPGIMSARVIDDRRDRLTTILIAPLMTCSARIPVYTPLMLDLPDYKIPQLRGVVLGLWQRARAFLRRAGTIIFYASVVVWVLSTFPFPPEGATGPAINYSFAAMIGHLLEPILSPIGFTWQICVALVPGMAAREVAVAGLSTVYAVSGGEAALGSTLAAHWPLATGVSLLVWYIFAPQCLSTLAVIKRETGTARWMWVTVVYMFGLAYVFSFIAYHLVRALGG